jgi:hypothetical protein
MSRRLIALLVFLTITICVVVAQAAVTFPPQVESACATQGGCVWVSKKWLTDRIDEAREEAFTAGKRESDITCGKKA